MTPVEIIELRRRIADAARKARELHVANPRSPAIRYALDPEILTDEMFEVVLRPPGDLGIDNIVYINHLKSLCQFRKYYENGNGNNWNNFNLNNYNRYLHQGYQADERVSGERVHAECWILAAVQCGHCSDLTEGMRFLLNSLRPDFGNDEFDAAMNCLQLQPNASNGQIAAAKLYPEAFKAILNTLLTGEGEGWLACFKDHLLRREILRPQWGIYSNGNHHDMALCIPTNSRQVEITQGNHSMLLRPHQGRLIVTLGLMRRAGIDPHRSCSVANDPLPALDFNFPLIARVRRNSPFSPFLENNAILQIQATGLWVAVPADSDGEFQLGEEFPDIDFEKTIPGFGRIRKLALGNINRRQPRPLTFAGQCLVNIGAAPELAVTNGDPWIQSLDEPETRFVFAIGPS